MGLEKAIAHGKEKRKAFSRENGTYAKSIDHTCRNHGSCGWCMGNRVYKNLKVNEAVKQRLEEIDRG